MIWKRRIAMNAGKTDFYELAARGYAASVALYRIDSIVHVEDKDDIWFWNQVLSHYRPAKYLFRPGSVNADGKYTTGCCQCLKYKDFLSQRFFICIDSDLRYLLDEPISAHQGVLQTYTYSWENHCCFAHKLQEKFDELTGHCGVFDFEAFLKRYSEILYEPFLLMLYCQRNGLGIFDRAVFKRLVSIQYRQGDEHANGRRLLDRLAEKMSAAMPDDLVGLGFDVDAQRSYYAQKGICTDNVYLYVRGHSLYNMLISLGKQICAHRGVDFENSILKSVVYAEYSAFSKIVDDINVLNGIRMTY